MKRMWMATVLVCLCFPGFAAGAEYCVVPFDVDPPIQVDGKLDDWGNIPNPISMPDKSHVTYIREWKLYEGPGDLSAVVRLAWRYDGLLVAADVTDDIVQQPYRGRDVWKGDYVNLWLDMTPAFESERTVLGKGQYHIGMSPGNFGGTAGGEGVIPPRVFAFMPQNMELPHGLVAAQRTDKGYVIEAFIPFADLEIEGVRRNTFAMFEIAVSDSDGTPAAQDYIMTSGTEKWALSRTRLLPLLFGDGNGQADTPGKTIAISSEEYRFKPNEARTLTFDVDTAPGDMDVFLFLRGRSQTEKAAGYCNWALAAEVNGKRLEEDRLSNRPASMRMPNGHTLNVIHTDGTLTVPHEPEFGAADADGHYRVIDQKASEFEFNLEGVLKPGRNELILRNTSREWKGVYPRIIAGNVELRVRPRQAGTGVARPAPMGALPVIEPQRAFPKTYAGLKHAANRISLTVNGGAVDVVSRFSTPDGKWHDGATRYYSFQRTVEPRDEWIIVKDTFRNLTDQNLPLMYAHRCTPAITKDIWLAGLKIGAKRSRTAQPANHGAFAATDKGGVGLVALNDEFRVHHEQNALDGAIDLGDYSFVLQPGKEYTAEWAIVTTASPDFWRFVNTARRMLDVNFPLKHLFAFAFKRPPVYDWSDERLKQFITNKSANFVVQSNYGVLYKGKPARNTAWMMGPHDVYRDFQKRVHGLYPDGGVKTGIYYHCFLDTYEPNAERFAADRALDASGTHIRYGSGQYSYMTLFVPTLENGFGKEIGKVVDMILDDIGADGVFWDEFSYSTVPFCYGMWDGCSADIDRKTCQIRRLKCSLTLKSRAFRNFHVKRIMERGAPLLINGAPRTRTLARNKMQAFTETGSIVHCREMLLYSPVALGDHLTEREPRHAYKVMLNALDHGCLYAWYNTRIMPQHKMLTEHMFPFTPVEIHSGYVIGKERIITNRSGLYGWGDDAAFTAYVYDREGKATDKYPVKRVTQDGKSYAEVRIPGGYSVAIVREP